MKGFIYLIEIATAAIIMTIVLSVFFSIRIKQDWERTDLISIGSNVINSLNKQDIYDLLNENFNKIGKLLPNNVDFSLKTKGASKSNIIVGCSPIETCDYTRNYLLTPTYLNNRWVTFTVENFNMSDSEIPNYDAIVLVNFTNYSTYRSKINRYLANGGVVIGINATSGDKISQEALNFSEIFNISDP